MRHLNYNHLLYFWTIAREGSIAKASEVLHLTPQTISGQLKMLEESIGQKLFDRVGRGQTLSETEQIVHQYAEVIFTLGNELTYRVRDKSITTPVSLNIGIVNSIAKLIAYRIIDSVFDTTESIKTSCFEGDLDKLLGDLAIHKLDMIISDKPVPAGLNVKAYSHKLGISDIAFFSHESVRRDYLDNFPESLHDAPFLLPLPSTPLRRLIDDWLERMSIRPKIIAEFDDSALMKAFGTGGKGIFPAPVVISKEVCEMYQASEIGRVPEIQEEYYAISPERKVKHPAMVTMKQISQETLFKQ